MKTYVNMMEEVMVVALNNTECCTVIEGGTVLTDQHCLDPEAQISVSEIGALDPTYVPAIEWGSKDFMRNLGRRSLVVVGHNFDLNCYVPKEVLRNTLAASERVNLSDIVIFDDRDSTQLIRNMFPPNGVELRFNGHNRHYGRNVLDYIPS